MVKNHWKYQPMCTASHLADKFDQIQTQEDWLADLILGEWGIWLEIPIFVREEGKKKMEASYHSGSNTLVLKFDCSLNGLGSF